MIWGGQKEGKTKLYLAFVGVERPCLVQKNLQSFLILRHIMNEVLNINENKN